MSDDLPKSLVILTVCKTIITENKFQNEYYLLTVTVTVTTTTTTTTIADSPVKYWGILLEQNFTTRTMSYYLHATMSIWIRKKTLQILPNNVT